MFEQDTTWVALTVLGGVFIIIIITILKSGVDDALKMMGALGTMFGVLIGGIGTQYFAKEEIKKANIRAKEGYQVANVISEELQELSTSVGKINSQITSLKQGTAEVGGASVLPNFNTIDISNFKGAKVKNLSEIKVKIDQSTSKLNEYLESNKQFKEEKIQ